MSALTPEQAAAHLESLPGWELIEQGKAIYCAYAFKNFRLALSFVNQVGEAAEAARHHPDISLGWGYANMRLQTHSIGGLAEADFTLASKINALYQSAKELK